MTHKYDSPSYDMQIVQGMGAILGMGGGREIELTYWNGDS